jgi:hypothetical protein
VQKILASPTYRAKAQQLGQTIVQHAAASTAVTELEGIAQRHQLQAAQKPRPAVDLPAGYVLA